MPHSLWSMVVRKYFRLAVGVGSLGLPGEFRSWAQGSKTIIQLPVASSQQIGKDSQLFQEDSSAKAESASASDDKDKAVSCRGLFSASAPSPERQLEYLRQILRLRGSEAAETMRTRRSFVVRGAQWDIDILRQVRRGAGSVQSCVHSLGSQWSYSSLLV
jgi:hypothetical protein